MNDPHLCGRTARTTAPSFRQAWYATLQLRYARFAYALQSDLIKLAQAALLIVGLAVYVGCSLVWQRVSPKAPPPTEPMAASRAFLESQWSELPSDIQRERANQMNWDPITSDKRVFEKAERNAFELRRHWAELSQLQKDSVVAFCHAYPYCR